MLEVKNTKRSFYHETYLSGKAMAATNITEVLLDSQKGNIKLS